MKKTLLLFTAVLALSLHAAEIDKVSATLAGQEASFTQHFTPKGFKKAQTESGTVLFGALPQMRWSYAKPEQKLFVYDGNKSWFYVPAEKQVTVATIDAQRRRDLPFLLIGDPSAREKAFVVKEQARGAKIVTTLTPRDANGLLAAIVVTSSSATHLIDSVEYNDRQGNRTVFELSGYHPAAAGPDAFRFTPPAGVQQIEQ